MVNMRGQEADFASRDDHRGYVLKGAPWGTGVRVLRLMYDMGLRETDDVLDFGCGSLRIGRFLIMYLDPGHYFGIEPSGWAVDQGLRREVGSLADQRSPEFRYPEYGEFNAALFGKQRFDWVLISGILTHMDHAQIAATLGSAAKVLKPGGRIIGTYLPSGPDHTGEGWLYPQQACHARACLDERLPAPLQLADVDVPGDPASWFVAQ